MSAWAESSTRSSWVFHLPTACGLQCPVAAAVVTKSRSNLVPSRPNLPYVLEDQRSYSHWFRRSYIVTFCVRASHADVYPELLQDAREQGDHVQDGAPHLGRRFVFVLAHVTVIASARSVVQHRASHRVAVLWPSSIARSVMPLSGVLCMAVQFVPVLAPRH